MGYPEIILSGKVFPPAFVWNSVLFTFPFSAHLGTPSDVKPTTTLRYSTRSIRPADKSSLWVSTDLALQAKSSILYCG